MPRALAEVPRRSHRHSPRTGPYSSGAGASGTDASASLGAPEARRASARLIGTSWGDGLARIAQTPDELRAHLRDHIGFIRDGGARFDDGSRSYAKQIAVSLRVLLHDTSQSHSLLGQLGLKDGLRLLDTAAQLIESNLAPSANLVYMRGTVAEDGSLVPSYEPVFDDYQHRTFFVRPSAFGTVREPAAGRALAFEDWWALPVIQEPNRGEVFTRRDLVLALSNWDGGAHVDSAVPEAYHRLSRSNSLGFGVGNDEDLEAFGDPVPPSVRQIGHELLRSLPRSLG